MYIQNNIKSILKHLQLLQELYMGVIDIEISTRKDMKVTAISFCSYDYNIVSKELTNKTKLYVHKFEWSKSDYELQEELELVIKELANIYINYIK